MSACCECGTEFVGAGFPIGTISSPNCGNCYGFVDGVFQEETWLEADGVWIMENL